MRITTEWRLLQRLAFTKILQCKGNKSSPPRAFRRASEPLDPFCKARRWSNPAITSARGESGALDASGVTFPLAWFVAAGVIIGAGAMCGLIASIRADARNYTSAQARIAFKAGGGLLLATIVFALTGLAVIALGFVVAAIIFVLGVIVLAVLLAISF